MGVKRQQQDARGAERADKELGVGSESHMRLIRASLNLKSWAHTGDAASQTAYTKGIHTSARI